ncbi:MAG: T9SS type A sorting domain-containing protein [Flavobacteriales bacterium]
MVHPSGADLQLHALDMDADGDLDMAGLFAGHTFKWFENTDGLGTFGSALEIADLLDECSRFDIADLDTDGLPDLVLLSTFDEVFVVRNFGAGSFSTPTSLGFPGMATGAIRIGELTGDGLPDIILTLTDVDGNGIGWFAGNGTGFEPLALAPLQIGGTVSSYIAVADMDLVGGIDVVVNGDNMVLALRNSNGDATAWEVDTISIWSEYPYNEPQLIDIDHDGDLDLAEAGNVSVHWAENPLGEGGLWGTFTDHTLEPFTSAGHGMFGHNGCGERTTLVYVPSNPGLPVRWSAWVDELDDFAYRNDVPGVPRGTDPLLADLNGDGKDDLVLGHPAGTEWYASELEEASTTLVLPAFQTLCVVGSPLAMPEAEPAGGQWSGQWIDQNILYRSNLGVTGIYPLSHTYYEPQGCPVAAVTSIQLLEGPVITPALPNVLCSGQPPIQMTSEPANVTWFGLDAGNILDPATFANGIVSCVFLDSTGAECASQTEPITVWTSLAAEIETAGPFCITDGEQLITALAQPPFGTSWSGDIVSWNSAGATFDPSIGAGDHLVILDVTAGGPGQCGNSDTLVISVSDAIPVVTTTDLAPHCADGSSFALTGAEPIGGTWSGPGVDNGLMLDPSQLTAGTYALSYTYQDPAGCAASGLAYVELVDSVALSWTVEDLIFCTTDPEVAFDAAPAGGTWSAPLSADGVLAPGTLTTGTYDLSYIWSGPNGCVLTNEPATFEIGAESVVTVDPVGTLCTTGAGVFITGSPSGTWSGTVTGQGGLVVFEPSVVGVGLWPVTLTAAAPGECPGTSTILVEVEICSGLAEQAGTTLGLMPNPFNGQTTLTLSGAGKAQVDVLDATGRLVLSVPGTLAGTTTLPLDLGAQPNGTYTVRVLENGRFQYLRAVKAD